MVSVANPLHYKRLITKKKLHLVFLLIFVFVSIIITCFFVYLKQDTFTILKECVIQYVVHAEAYFTCVSFIYTCIITMTINCIIISIKLHKMKKIALGTKTCTQDNDQKLTQATWLALKLFLLFVVPVTFLGAVTLFLQHPYPMFYDILLDLSYLLLYMNNVVNPFVYYIFLKDFKRAINLYYAVKQTKVMQETLEDLSVPLYQWHYQKFRNFAPNNIISCLLQLESKFIGVIQIYPWIIYKHKTIN